MNAQVRPAIVAARFHRFPPTITHPRHQLDYPVQNMLDTTWKLWLEDIGSDALVSSMLDFEDCGMILGTTFATRTILDNFSNTA